MCLSKMHEGAGEGGRCGRRDDGGRNRADHRVGNELGECGEIVGGLPGGSACTPLGAMGSSASYPS